MKLIGIIGKSGSGKTTLSKMLQKNNSIGIIHLDEITEEIKRKMPSSLVNKDIKTNTQGEEYFLLNGNFRKIRDILVKNKILKKLYFGIAHLSKEFYMKKALNQKIEEGKETIIIERNYIRKFQII